MCTAPWIPWWPWWKAPWHHDRYSIDNVSMPRQCSIDAVCILSTVSITYRYSIVTVSDTVLTLYLCSTETMLSWHPVRSLWQAIRCKQERSATRRFGRRIHQQFMAAILSHQWHQGSRVVFAIKFHWTKTEREVWALERTVRLVNREHRLPFTGL